MLKAGVEYIVGKTDDDHDFEQIFELEIPVQCTVVHGREGGRVSHTVQICISWLCYVHETR